MVLLPIHISTSPLHVRLYLLPELLLHCFIVREVACCLDEVPCDLLYLGAPVFKLRMRELTTSKQQQQQQELPVSVSVVQTFADKCGHEEAKGLRRPCCAVA